MRTLLLCLTIAFGTIFGQSQDNSPLTPGEGRQILGQLQELQTARQEARVLTDYIARDKEQDAREKANTDRALELVQQATAIVQRERDLQKEKAEMYEQLYKSVTKGPGVGCRILRIVTVGIYRCQ